MLHGDVDADIFLESAPVGAEGALVGLDVHVVHNVCPHIEPLDGGVGTQAAAMHHGLDGSVGGYHGLDFPP